MELNDVVDYRLLANIALIIKSSDLKISYFLNS